MKNTLPALLVLFVSVLSLAQTSTVPEAGVRDRFPTDVALTNAKLVTEPGEEIERGSVLIKDGVIQAVGEIDIPNHVRKIDCEGKVIYPALIEACYEVDVAAKETATAHWNSQVRPEWSVSDSWEGSKGGKSHESLRKEGFAIGLLVPKSGVLKGQSVAVSLGSRSSADSVIKQKVAQHIRLTTSRSRDSFPGSPMGAVALARQTFYDAQWHDKAWRAYRANSDVPRPEANAALETLAAAVAHDSLFIFDTMDEQYALRANRFAIEFGLNRIALRGSGREYQRLDAITKAGHTIIVPLNFPKAPNVATPEAARAATLADLMHWRLAPENPARLRAAGANVVLTTHQLKNKSDLRKKLREAIEGGLDANDALAALTVEPAKLLGIDGKAGTIVVGNAANLMICDGDWLAEKTKIVETWVDGERFEHETHDEENFSGVWKLVLETANDSRDTLYLSIKQEGEKSTGKAWTEDPNNGGESRTDLKHLKTAFARVSASFSAKLWDADHTVRLSATRLGDEDSPELVGEVLDETGKRIRFTGSRVSKEVPDNKGDKSDDEDDETNPDGENADGEEEDEGAEEDKESKVATPAIPLAVNYPLGAYGVANPNRKQTSVVLENATVWTCGPDRILKNASVLIEEGKIKAVGSNLELPAGTKRVDATGKHITPGIIDCHSHMATDGGVNESTQAITCEVRIGDFIDATDISIYRQLAGGVTTSNILHGSANPIGGQNQVIKLRWGKLPEELKFANAPFGVKFALGENVKQANWGDEYRTRYPQSRLGVEQIMRDALLAAKDYGQRWEDWKTNGNGLPPRRDLELDALLEILNGQRWIHCHSYRQDEILALIRTLDDFDVTIGTFQHILEGYKVAREMAEHGAMGSSFSDWWAYKFEVYDAIPYNGKLMHDAGVVVSFNSDDIELARHLNHEAAKAVKYGGVPPEEALKFVTLNPAKQLRIDQFVGSLEAGKHADVVVWSGDPLQATSRCEQTWIDGVRYFDIDEDKEIRAAEAKIRNRLVRQILDSGKPMRAVGEKEELWRDMFPRHDEYCGHGGLGHVHD